MLFKVECKAPTAMEHIKNKAIRLIDYLTELALLRSKIVRDISAYQSVLWLGASSV
jgi:hypothetical protein